MATGRPPRLSLDPELRDRIMKKITLGTFPAVAAASEGVPERTHYLWQAKGVEERERRDAGRAPRKTWQVYVEYSDALDRSLAQAETTLMLSALQGNDMAMKVLERRFRERWSAKATPATGAPTVGAASVGVTPYAAFEERREARRVKRAGH